MGTTKNYPCVTAKYFLDFVHSVRGGPHIVRADNGTENVNMAAIQCFFRREAADAFADQKSFLYGSSISSQRIEAWWSQLRQG